MHLPPVYGHVDVRRQLLAALRAGNLPQSLLLHGPPGVGKERVGLWLAQLILCLTPAADGDACGSCQSCRFVERLEHPDVHWFFPLPRPDASTPEKLREKLEEARFAELAERRADAFHVPAFEKAPTYFLGMVQNLQRLASVRPAMGSRKVFLVGDAELMVPQESSPEAANAFLKLLEEPPADTTLILTSANPGALLPTIRSRVLPVRLLRLPISEVAGFLAGEKGLPPAEAERLAALSEGAIGRALRLLPTSGGAGAPQRQRDTARRLLLAATASSEVERLAAANGIAPAGARGEFTAGLEALSQWLRDLMAVASGAPEQVAYTDDATLLTSLVKKARVAPEGVASALLRVQEARDLAAGNVNPQLILADLLRGLRLDLVGAG
jgi:DNA polymerase III subunit delta'